MAMATAALIITIPALWGTSAGVPFAFLAVISISVIGLYIAYIIPVFLRWRQGRQLPAGPWNNGRKYKLDEHPIATIWVGIITMIFCLPFVPAAVPGTMPFTGKRSITRRCVPFGDPAGAGSPGW